MPYRRRDLVASILSNRPSVNSIAELVSEVRPQPETGHDVELGRLQPCLNAGGIAACSAPDSAEPGTS